MRSFLRDIRAAPDDDAPRLRCAEALRGDPRGELIEVQCALARLPRRDHRRPELRAREAALLLEHGAEWAADVVEAFGARSVRFVRGFIEHVELEARAFIDGGVAFIGSTVRSVRLVDVGGLLEDVLSCAQLELIEALDLANAGLGNDAAGLLADAPRLGALRALDLGHNEIDDRGVERLARSRHLVLERLGLAANVIELDGVRALVAARLATGLRDLDLARVPFGAQELGNAIGPEAIGLLTALPLARLVLSGNPVDRGGIEALSRDGALALEELELHDARIGPSAAWALAAAPTLARLDRLDLSGNALGAGGVAALVDSPFLPHELTLDVGGCDLDEDALAALRRRFAEVVGEPRPEPDDS